MMMRDINIDTACASRDTEMQRWHVWPFDILTLSAVIEVIRHRVYYIHVTIHSCLVPIYILTDS